MNPAARAWARKAEADARVAQREMRVRKNPSYDAVCFHAQQCAEKYFKALLAQNSAAVPKTHDLILLRTLVRPYGGAVRVAGLGRLSLGAVEYRYPGRQATRHGARRAVETMQRVRRLTRMALGLP